MTLEADVALRLGALDLEVSLQAGPGEVVAVLGPNGAGKTTLLRVLAGLVAPDSGRVVLDGQVLDDTAAGVHVPPDRRPVGMVFQDHLLFPHLTVLDNVAFGLRSRGASRAAARSRALDWLRETGLEDLAPRLPEGLSGGEAQRIAVARAMVGAPRLLMLDEATAALDVSARAEVRRDIRRRLAGYRGTPVLVTHDPLEAMVLGDRLVVLEKGRVVQSGPAAELRRRPRSRYVADLVGVNLFSGEADGNRVSVAGGALTLVVAERARGAVYAMVRPQAVALHRQPPEGTPRNVWSGTVDGLDVDGRSGRARVRVAVPGAGPVVVADISEEAASDLRLAEGVPVWASVKAAEVTIYPA